MSRTGLSGLSQVQISVLLPSHAGLRAVCAGTRRLNQPTEPWKKALHRHNLWQIYFIIREEWHFHFFFIWKHCEWRILWVCPLTSFLPNHPCMRLRHILLEAGGKFHTTLTVTGIEPTWFGAKLGRQNLPQQSLSFVTNERPFQCGNNIYLHWKCFQYVVNLCVR